MWQQSDDDGVWWEWAEAVYYCEGLSLGGHSDWRLPSRQELLSIVDYGRYRPAVNPAFACHGVEYWSGSTRAIAWDYAWYVDFYYGYAEFWYKTSSYSVRCVRGGP